MNPFPLVFLASDLDIISQVFHSPKVLYQHMISFYEAEFGLAWLGIRDVTWSKLLEFEQRNKVPYEYPFSVSKNQISMTKLQEI